MTSSALAPIERSVSVSWAPAVAFQRFTGRFDAWWPTRTHSIGGARVARVVFEPRVGGRIYEEHLDGRRFQWGEVLIWQPPARVRFTWHPARDPSTAQEVEVEFLPEGTGTRLVLTANGWERWGKGAARARRGYRLGWGYVLNIWAERRTVGMSVADAILAAVNFAQRFRGGVDAEIARAGGRM